MCDRGRRCCATMAPDAMPPPATNPLVDDRDVELILDEVLDLGRLLRLPHFAEHDRETCQMLIASARDLARGALFPADRALAAAPPRPAWSMAAWSCTRGCASSTRG